MITSKKYFEYITRDESFKDYLIGKIDDAIEDQARTLRLNRILNGANHMLLADRQIDVHILDFEKKYAGSEAVLQDTLFEIKKLYTANGYDIDFEFVAPGFTGNEVACIFIKPIDR